MTPEEIKELRQSKRDEVASQTSVKYLLEVGKHRSLLVLMASFVLAITIVGIGLYLYEAILLLYNSVFASNSAGLLNFATTSIIVFTTFFGIKSQGVDRYIQNQIKDTLFVMRSDAILKGDIPESYVPDVPEPISVLIYENWLSQFTAIFAPVTTKLAKSASYDSSSDIGSDEDDEMEEPGSSMKSRFELPKKKKYQVFRGHWGMDQMPSILYQFDIQEKLQETVFSKIQQITASSFPTQKLWVQNAVLVQDEPMESEYSQTKTSPYKTHEVKGQAYKPISGGANLQETSEGHIYCMIKATTTLREMPENVDRRKKINKDTLNLMKLYADHVAKLHKQGLFGNLSLSTACWVTKGYNGWVASFNPEWIFTEMTDEQKEKSKKHEVIVFGAILLEFLYDIPQVEIDEMRNKSVVYLSNIQPAEVWRLSPKIQENEIMKNLLASMFGFADKRPTMAMVADTLKLCYEERDKLGQRKT